MAYAGNVEKVDENMTSKGWGKIGVSRTTNGTSAEKDFAAIVNLSNALVPVNGANTYDSPAQKLSLTVQHETGHPKFIGHNKAENYNHLNKRPGKVPSHVLYTIMDANFTKNAKHDLQMRIMLNKLHGVRTCCCKMLPFGK